MHAHRFCNPGAGAVTRKMYRNMSRESVHQLTVRVLKLKAPQLHCLVLAEALGSQDGGRPSKEVASSAFEVVMVSLDTWNYQQVLGRQIHMYI